MDNEWLTHITKLGSEPNWEMDFCRRQFARQQGVKREANRLVFQALQRSLSSKLSLSRSDAVKRFKTVGSTFDRRGTTLCRHFLIFKPFSKRKNPLLIESRP